MKEFLNYSQDFLGHKLFHIGGKVVSVGDFAGAFALVIGIWWFASLVERSLIRVTRNYADEPWKTARIHMLSRLLRYGMWIIGTIVGLAYFGIDLTSIALLGSAFAVGLGFGLQNIFSNLVSGIIILLEHSLKVGDFVDLQSGVRGTVREIGMRFTRVTTNDSLDILVPNSEFVNGRVANWTLDEAHRRMRIPFDVSYGTPKELVREAGIAATKTVAGVIDSEVMKSTVWLVSYGDSSMSYELVVWADKTLIGSPAATHAKLMWALDTELRARDIEIPFPQRDLHIRSGILDVRVTSPLPAEVSTDRTSQ